MFPSVSDQTGEWLSLPRRLEKEKEKQELMRQGLLPTPKPKVKLSTFHRSLGVEASADPTAVEAQVRADQDARQQVTIFLVTDSL